MGFLLCEMLKPMTSTPWDCNNAFKVITRAIRREAQGSKASVQTWPPVIRGTTDNEAIST
jgi:hypothetical protein